MDRRKFLLSTGLLCAGVATIPTLYGCNGPTEPQNQDAKNDFNFSNSSSDSVLSKTISSSSTNIIKPAAVDKKPITIAVDSTIITLTPIGSKIEISKGTDKVFLRFGTIKTSPSLILERQDGSIIQEKSIVPSGENWTPEDWLAKAVLVLAGALTIWLGATVVKLIAAAIAFIAMNFLILSIIVAATAVLAWLLERAGWSFDGIIQILKDGVDWIKDLLRDIVNNLP